MSADSAGVWQRAWIGEEISEGVSGDVWTTWVYKVECGIPFACLQAEEWFEVAHDQQRRALRIASDMPSGGVLSNGVVLGNARGPDTFRLPIAMVPSGFLANVVFYSLVCEVAWAGMRKVRRSWVGVKT